MIAEAKTQLFFISYAAKPLCLNIHVNTEQQHTWRKIRLNILSLNHVYQLCFCTNVTKIH